MPTSKDLIALLGRLDEIQNALQADDFCTRIDALEAAAKSVGDAWSGSWIGYHALVYYDELQPPPPGAHFSSEWGLRDTFSMGTTGEWAEYSSAGVTEAILDRAGNPNLDDVRTRSEKAKREFNDVRSEALSIIETALSAKPDKFLERLLEEASEIQTVVSSEMVAAIRPGTMMSRDALAIGQGIRTPPHIKILADVLALRSPLTCSSKLALIVRRAASHLGRTEQVRSRSERVGTNVFIGHGRSKDWKDLKDFVQDRLRLPWDEFNRVPVAGVTNIARLSEMLDAAAIAFLVMTAEDEQVDGKLHARLNVVHEAGLFQGRLGFSRAIVLLEDGCEEFSNIAGLGQIRFPKGHIKSAFEEIRRVLEREDLVT